MPTTLQLVEGALGRDKLTVLATAIDQVAEQLGSGRSTTLEDEIETLNIQDLAEHYGVGFETLRKQIVGTLEPGAVFRLGKTWVIRKRRFLDFLQAKESDGRRS